MYRDSGEKKKSWGATKEEISLIYRVSREKKKKS